VNDLARLEGVKGGGVCRRTARQILSAERAINDVSEERLSRTSFVLVESDVDGVSSA
jgi:hypothetical protein